MVCMFVCKCGGQRSFVCHGMCQAICLSISHRLLCLRLPLLNLHTGITNRFCPKQLLHKLWGDFNSGPYAGSPWTLSLQWYIKCTYHILIFSFLFDFVLFCFWYKVWLWWPDWPRLHYVGQTASDSLRSFYLCLLSSRIIFWKFHVWILYLHNFPLFQLFLCLPSKYWLHLL